MCFHWYMLWLTGNFKFYLSQSTLKVKLTPEKQLVCMQTSLLYHTRNFNFRKVKWNITHFQTPEKHWLARCAILPAANLRCAIEKAVSASMGMLWLTGNFNVYIYLSLSTFRAILSSVLSKNKVVSAHAPVHAIDATKEWCTARNLMHNNLNYFNIEINQPSSQKKIFRLIYYKGTGGTMVSLVY